LIAQRRRWALRLLIWKAHYSGDIALFRGTADAPERKNIYEFPTVSFQFPLELASSGLLRALDEKQDSTSEFGPKVPERLNVLLSHNAIIIRPRNGRFDWRLSSGRSHKPSSSDLVIPIREDDLDDYEDTYGSGDGGLFLDVRRY
jgi:hypothetical protein